MFTRRLGVAGSAGRQNEKGSLGRLILLKKGRRQTGMHGNMVRCGAGNSNFVLPDCLACATGRV